LNFNKFKIWAVTDGSQGMISQVMGLSKQISPNIREIRIDLIFPWNKLQPGFLPIYEWIFKNKIPQDEKPDILISCGRKSVYFSLYCKKKFYKLVNIHIQNPKIPAKNFDYIISPNHDNFVGSNVLNSVGALHHFRKDNKSKKQDLLTCIVGGDNQHYTFDYKEADKLCMKLLELKKNHLNINLKVITSRRTSQIAKNIINKKLKNIASIWNGEGKNPYEEAIQSSSFFIVTSDSTSMISEAAISGKPIYIYHLPFKRKSVRISNFHEEFSKIGITRDLKNIKHLENWDYNLLNESERIGSIIKKRIIEDII
tara:strand:- start:503 stop:1438 length:936 start_codon:yes stop_codon:yes gene_type:complete